MTAQAYPYIRSRSAAAQRRRQRRRRYELINAVLEAIVTLGIGAGFIVCSILFLCVI